MPSKTLVEEWFTNRHPKYLLDLEKTYGFSYSAAHFNERLTEEP